MRVKVFRKAATVLTSAVMIWGLIVPVPMSAVQSVNGQEIVENFAVPVPIEPSMEKVKTSMGRSSVEFEENRGQFDQRVRFVARGAGSTVFLTATEAVYVLPVPEHRKPRLDYVEPSHEDPMRKLKERKPSRAVALRMQIVGAHPNSGFAGEEQTEHQTNYFRGSDPDNWHTEIPNYRRIRYDNVYDGIGMVWHGRERGGTQYDFVVGPNADPNQVSLRFEGADRLETDADGNLLIHTEAGLLKQTKPFTYQETDGFRTEVESGFVVEGNIVRFAVADYDRSKPLTIDPSVNLSNLSYSTFIGPGSAERIATDQSGNVYITGAPHSFSFPTVTGSFDTSMSNSDIFVTKLNTSATGLVYSTFLGGLGGSEVAGDIAVDAAGNAYVTGYSRSGDYPVTANAFDTSYNGNSDAFVTKIGASGSRLTFSTFLGGSHDDGGAGIALDNSGRVFIAASTELGEINFPTTPGAFRASHTGGYSSDAAVAIFDPSGTTLIYSTFIGSSRNDGCAAIAVDPNGNALITGLTVSADINFPTTSSAFDASPNGGYDIFVAKIDPDLTGTASLAYSTLLGGNGDEYVRGIAVDTSGNVYLTGRSSDSAVDYPTTIGAFDRVPARIDAIVSKVNPNASGQSSLVYSTFIGGPMDDEASGLAVDSSGNAYVAGITNREGNGYPTFSFPVTTGAFDTSYNGHDEAFLTKINSSGSALLYSTYLGNSGAESVGDVCIDSAGNAFVAGESGGSLFPTTSGVFKEQSDYSEIFVAKFGDFSISGRVLSTFGKVMPGVLVTLSGSVSGTTTTASDGRFYFGDTVAGGYHIVAAAANGFVFSPPSFTINPLSGNQDLIFVGQPSN